MNENIEGIIKDYLPKTVYVCVLTKYKNNGYSSTINEKYTYAFSSKEKALEKIKNYLYNKTDLFNDEGEGTRFCPITQMFYTPMTYEKLLNNFENKITTYGNNFEIDFFETELNTFVE